MHSQLPLSIMKLPKSEEQILPIWGNSRVVQSSKMLGGYHKIEIYSPQLLEKAKPGQFIMLSPPDGQQRKMILPRPMAIHRKHEDRGTFEVIFKKVGVGTAQLAQTQRDENIYVIGPLGNGFHIPASTKGILLIGRGIGICSIAPVAQEAQKLNIDVTALLSSRADSECVGLGDFQEFEAEILKVSDDTFSSEIYNVEKLLSDRFSIRKPDAIMVCGSNRLIELASRLGALWGVGVQASLEAHMACGLGYCHGCSLGLVNNGKGEGLLVCSDGPIFEVEQSLPVPMHS